MGKMIDIETSFKGYLAEPDGNVRGGVIVIHEVWGLVDQTKSVADRLAAEGYVALAPDLLSDTEIAEAATPAMQEALFDPERRNGVQTQLRQLMAPMMAPEFGARTLAKVRHTFDALYDLDGVDGRVAVWGFCFGGTYTSFPGGR